MDIHNMVYQGKFLDTGRADDVRDVVRHSEHFTKFFNVLESF